ncbi:MAG: 16S rRNA (guanine(527)-N(7))-methyltransferase RsmG [Oceanospirillaceae bacterium]|nr:16S rRNA (guanine(527)-N(7))-methyltransferase RsmG [Oceanospirillaceae bacterium]
MADLQKLLDQGLKDLGIAATERQTSQLLRYLELMQKWNKAYNLTAIRDPQQMLVRHLLDSLAVVPHIAQTDLIDVGSGGGLPGIPLAILSPQQPITTLDSNSKKTRFQSQVKIELGLTNLEVIHGRVEALENRQFSQVISRAFASIIDMVTLSQGLLAEKGVFLAMKGRYPDAELAELPLQFRLQQSYALHIPGLEEERHLLVLGRA